MPSTRPRRSPGAALLLRLTALFALTALLLAGAFALIGTTAAQESSDSSQDGEQVEQEDSDDSEESDGSEDSDDSTEEEEEAEAEPGPAWKINHEAHVETSCSARDASVACTLQNRYFAFDTQYEYYEFLLERTNWQHSRYDLDAPEASMSYWQDYRSSTTEWEDGTLVDADRDPPTTAELSVVSLRVPTDCNENVFDCGYAGYEFTFDDINDAITFMEEREDWIYAVGQDDTSVSGTWWFSYSSNAPLPPATPPYLANQLYTVETECPDGRRYNRSCTTEDRYFHFHTEADYFNFLKQRGDWQMRRFNRDRDAEDAVTVDLDYYQDFTSNPGEDPRPELDESVSAELNLVDVKISVNSTCNGDRSHCSQLLRFFDFEDNEDAIAFANERLDWLDDRFNAVRSASPHWWKDYAWTPKRGAVPYKQNFRIHVHRSCRTSWLSGQTSCRGGFYYFNFATQTDYLYFLRKWGDYWMYRYDDDAPRVSTTFWKSFKNDDERLPENTPAGDPVKDSIDIDALRVWVPNNCRISNIQGCNAEQREFSFRNQGQAIDFMEERKAWHTAAVSDDSGPSPNWWKDYRNWVWKPSVLQGLRINSIPWCQQESGQQVCYEVTRYFWYNTWRVRGEFQRAHEAWQDGTATDWEFWMDYDWNFEDKRSGIVTWNDGQNHAYNVPVGCTGPYTCIHDQRYFNFSTSAEKTGFDELHAEQQNDGTKGTFYWLSYRFWDTPH